MKNLTLLLAAALLAGLVWAQPFAGDAERGPKHLRHATEMQLQLHEAGECDGAMTQTRHGRGTGGMAMLQQQAQDGTGEHAHGPRGRGQRRGTS
jgi:hypothetical protein